MKGNGGRSRAARESSQCERDPFGHGLRQKSTPTVETPRRRGRNNGENLAPEINVLDVQSTVPGKGTTKGSKTPIKDGLVANTPALMPKLPKPSPARNVPPSGEAQDAVVEAPPTGSGADQANGPKRKLILDVQTGGVTEGMVNSPAVDPSDTGVKVIVRVRPLNQKETVEEATHVVQKSSTNSLSLGDQQFTYDAVAGETESQQAVFEMVGLPMVENCLAGFNSSIFAYGQTGSGKTHTMWGPLPNSGTELMPTEERGVTPRVFEQLFARIQQEERNNVVKQLRYQCRCSFLEIYNEQITDLLEPSQKNLMIREDTKTGVYVEGLTEEYVSNMDDVTSLLVRGLANRRTGSTAMNNESSRSHSVFTFVIESRSKSVAEGVSSVRTSRMNLVDLAGSERQKQTGAAGDRLKEAGNINKSLSQLGNVINILAEVSQTGKQRHIPYRSSRLTFLLQESLGGNAKLAMICAISPASSCRTETLSTLRFAQRAKAIQNKAVVNEETANDVNLLREQIRQLKDELMRMKANGNQQDGSTGGVSTGWNARRSYNLLRLSLGQPMTISQAEINQIDEESEQGTEEDESVDEDLPDKCASFMDVETKELLPKTEIKSAELTNFETKPQAEEPEGVRKNESLTPTGFPELTLSLISPTLSTSPKVKEDKKRDSGVDNTVGLPKSPLGMRSSKAFASSTEQLAASLTRGIDILDSQHRYSLSLARRFSGVRFSFQNGECPHSPKSEAVLLSRLISSSNTPLSQGARDVHKSALMTLPATQPESAGVAELSPSPQTMYEDSRKIVHITPLQKYHSQDMEVLLTGALRREKVAEATIAQQAADIEQLSRLVRQYKLERECNAVIQQSREEKISRMESLMDGVLPSEDFRSDELAALQLEYKTLQEKFDEHPELAEAKAEQELLLHELQRYKTFCDLGERDKLQQEICHLRNQLHLYLETASPGSLKKQRLSLTPNKGVPPHSPVKLMSLSAVPEAIPSCESASSSNHVKDEAPMLTVEANVSEHLEQEQKEWDYREKDWISIMQELREELDHHIQLAEKRRKELEGERRCTQEIHDALQMAMTGHAHLLDQYAELQEKHILLLANMRKIRDGVNEFKKEAKKSGLNAVEDRWFDVQATQIMFMKVEQDRYKEEIQGLKAQLKDTADAVQAAGELLVRLKEAERAANLAKHTAAVAEQGADELRRELEKSTRRHAKEVAKLQQRLLSASSGTSSLCARSAGMASIASEDRNYADCVEANIISNEDTLETAAVHKEEKGSSGVSHSLNSLTSLSESTDSKHGDEDSKIGGEYDSEPETNDADIDIHSLGFSRAQYQNLENLEIEAFDDLDDDEFLCEHCAQPATNGMRVCDSCI